MIQPRFGVAGAIALALLLSACGGGGGASGAPTSPEVQVQTHVELLASSVRGIENIAFQGNSAYVGLANSASEPTAVMTTALPVQANSNWTDVALGSCALAKATDSLPTRAPRLKTFGSTVWLFQPWYDDPATVNDHALCGLDANTTAFTPRDAGLKSCAFGFCSTLWMTDMKQVGTRLFTNAGAGPNLFASDNQATSWRVLLGQFDSMICTHQVFQVLGDRILVGGECPLDSAYLRAYPLSADGGQLASTTALPVTLPDLENRNVQFIDAVGAQRVFAGVEGGLLRSDDGGRSFKFVIQQPLSGNTGYPYIRRFLSLKAKPDTLVVGGFDKANAKPYLAWSADGGDKWTDISALLPGYAGSGAEVMSLIEDPQGRIILTVNEGANVKGRLLLLALGNP